MDEMSGMMRKAMNHPDVYGAGAKSRRKYIKNPKDKIHVVMSEFKRGTLHSGGSGKIVKNRRQAIAIALSEARRVGARIPKK